MLFELAGERPIDRPVAGVVWAHRKLVHKDVLVASLSDDEHFDGQNTRDAKFTRDRFTNRCGLGTCFLSQALSRRGNHGADSVHLFGGCDRPRRDLTGGSTCAKGGNF
ncbi:Uncharacterised protein [Chlamydia trachomatis]|nr:Uncharacterised protein [Chlamydia trachomatis]